MMNINDKIYVAGHNWMVGSAIVRQLKSEWYINLITKTRQKLDLTNKVDVETFFEEEQPDYVFLAAAKVWWIVANRDYPAEFLYQNLQIQNNIIHQSYLSWVTKLLFLGSSCIYPKYCDQPMKEEYLLTWILEPTNEPYAIAKIAWIKMCQSYNRQYWTNCIACMPTNLYWDNDNFDLETSHVLPAMIRKFHEAKTNWSDTVLLWWDWSPMREFLYVDDMAEACIYMMNTFNPTDEDNKQWNIFMNVWTWKDITIKELAETVRGIVWYKWNIIRDSDKPNGTLRKLLDVSKLKNAWWNYSLELHEWIQKTYKRFLHSQ